MTRRTFLKNAAAGVAVGTLAAPAIAQSQPTINWRMAASWPKSLDTLYGGAELISKRVGQMSGGKFNIKTLPAGTYTIEAWHEKLGTQTQQVTIGAKETKEITFTFKSTATN